MATRWVGRWQGGRIAERRDGRRVWYLERMVASVGRVSVALDVLNEGGALAQLALFDQNPAAWTRDRKGLPDPGAVVVNEVLVGAFLEHLKAAGRTLQYRQNLHLYLGAWREALAGRDLRAVTYPELRVLLDGWKTATRFRIIALKSFASYLREERGVLPRGSDPTLDLKVPPARPEKAVREKGYTPEHVAAVYRHIEPQDVRDVLCLLARCGMHETEVVRLARGEGEIRDVEGAGEIVGTFRFVHKSGRVHVQSVDAQTLAAARRLRAVAMARKAPWRGDNKRLHREIARAAELATLEARAVDKRAKAIPVLSPGELRHSFVTWRGRARKVSPAGGGVALADVADAIGHLSVRTTRTFYDGTMVPPMIVVPVELVHPEDPKG